MLLTVNRAGKALFFHLRTHTCILNTATKIIMFIMYANKNAGVIHSNDRDALCHINKNLETW